MEKTIEAKITQLLRQAAELFEQINDNSNSDDITKDAINLALLGVEIKIANNEEKEAV